MRNPLTRHIITGPAQRAAAMQRPPQVREGVVQPDLTVLLAGDDTSIPVTHSLASGTRCAVILANNRAYMLGSSSSEESAAFGYYTNAADFGADPSGITDARASIQSAMTAGAGGTIIIPSGRYLLSGHLAVPAGTRVLGYGATLVRGAAAASLLTNYPGGDTTTTGYNGRSGILIEGLSLDSRGDTIGTSANLMTFNHARDITVRDCQFYRVKGYHSLELNAMQDVLVENCTFRGYINDGGTGKEAVQVDVAIAGSVGSGAEDGTMARDVTVRDCSFGPDASGNPAPQVAVGSHSYAPGAFYENITVEGCRSQGIQQRMVQAYYWRNSRVAGCVADAPMAQGFRAEYCDGISFSGCRVDFEPGSGAQGVSVSTSTIRGEVDNCLVRYGAAGISVASGTALALISNNHTYRTSSYGVVVNNSTDSVVTGNLIQAAGFSGGALAAIRISDADGGSVRTSVTGNRVVLSGSGTEVSAGVSVAAGSTDTWVFGNDFKGLAAAITGTANTTSNRI